MTIPTPDTTSEITLFDAGSSSSNPYLNVLLLGNKWGGPVGSSATVYYSFPTSRSDEYWSQDFINGYGINDPMPSFKPDYVSLTPLSTSQQYGITLALNAWSNVANLDFIKVNETPSAVGDIRFGFTSDGAMSPNIYAYTYSVDPYWYDISDTLPYTRSGDIWFNKTQPYPSGNNFSTGAMGYLAGLHEIGHALGLDHSFAEEEGDIGLPANIDYFQYTVMSYSDLPGNYFDGLNEYYPTTPMLYDILAIQHLYGANNDYNSGDNVYEFSSSQRYYQTIWDAGGNDTIKYVSPTGGLINLEAGTFSQLGRSFKVGPNNSTIQQENVAIAFNVLIENAIGGNGNDRISGNSSDNILDGGAGNDTLDGKGGNDTLIGGKGNDTYIIDNSGVTVTEDANEGIDQVNASVSYTLAANVENLLLTGNGDIDGTGNELANTITGNAGDNILDGGAGVDKLAGGLGNDTYLVDLIQTGTTAAAFRVALQDTITEAVNAGNDTVKLRGDFNHINATTLTLGANLEKLDASATGTTKLNLTGNALANTLTGNDADNILDGGAGVDILQGGKGDDTYILDLKVTGTGISANVNTFDDSIIETNGSTNGVDTIKLRGAATLATATTLTLNGDWIDIENLDASATGKTKLDLTGNSLNNTLTGNAAANILKGLGGDDTYVVNNIDDTVEEDVNQGTDLVQASVTYTLGANVENLELLGTAAINGNGNGLVNTIIGNAGNNILDGKGGNDTLAGKKGNDTYIIDNSGVTVTEQANEGIDQVNASVSYTLAANVENLLLTGNGDIDGTGNELANTITGNAGDNILDGGAGVDKLIGGLGDDIYKVDLALTGTTAANFKVSLQDTITETAVANSGIDTVQLRLLAGIDYSTMANATTLTLGANLEKLDASATGLTKLNLTGNALANTLTGNDANNILDGGAGVDTLIGGEGDDTYVLDLKTATINGVVTAVVEDIVTETGGTTNGIDTIKLRGAATLATATTLALDGQWANAEILDASATGATKLNLTGNNLGNTLIGNAAANTLTGGTGNDILNGGAGIDTMIGGAGNDIYIVDNINDVVTELVNGGTDEVQASVTYSLALAAHVENLELMGTAAINGTGNADANVITGNAGNNILDGKGGNDTLIGGKGNDTYIIDNSGVTVTEGTNKGTDQVNASVNHVLAANVENLVLTGSANINGTGNELANTLTGNTGSNILDGGDGADKLIGGKDDDTYIVDLTRTGTTAANFKVALQDTITETAVAGSGTDTVQLRLLAGTDYSTMANATTLTLGANLEKLDASATGLTKLNLTGNALANTLTGNDADNIIDGGAGVDTLIGGDGDDTYILDLKVTGTGISANVNTFDDSIIETNGISNGIDTIKLRGAVTLANATTLALDGQWANAEILDASATGSTRLNLTANNNGNTLIGNAAANTLTGGTGNDTLNGGAGIDTMIAGAGNDIYIVDNINDVVTELVNGGTDEVQASVSYSLALAANVENLTLTGAAAINGTGNAGANVITGNTGNNIIDGGAGIDTLIGGKGNDTYIVDHSSDVVTELLNEGTDLVKASVSYTLSANVENLTLTDGSVNGGSAALNGTGNALANTITGNAGNNILDGGDGVDKLIGGNGDDTYIVDLQVKDRYMGSLYIGRDLVLEDTIIEAKNAGNDTLVLRGNAPGGYGLILADNIENMDAQSVIRIDGPSSAGINLYGNALDNRIWGNDQGNSIKGGAGNDTLYGGGGEDTLDGEEGANILVGGQASDTYIIRSSGDLIYELLSDFGTDKIFTYVSINFDLYPGVEYAYIAYGAQNVVISSSSGNIYSGSNKNDQLIGSDSNDTFMPSAGNDTLTGGLGADIFIWSFLEGPSGKPAIDKITDFNSAEDKLDLRDLLVGESSGNILNYLDITTSNTAGVTNTEIRISNTGGFTGGNYSAAAENQHITLAGINLLAGTNEADLLANLISQNKLVIDA